jgi:hypothetical protein
MEKPADCRLHIPFLFAELLKFEEEKKHGPNKVKTNVERFWKDNMLKAMANKKGGDNDDYIGAFFLREQPS